jgi:hypothetical protein
MVFCIFLLFIRSILFPLTKSSGAARGFLGGAFRFDLPGDWNRFGHPVPFYVILFKESSQEIGRWLFWKS